jgi:hypothetical protein
LSPHPPNFAPIAALALFGGTHFRDRRLAFLVPLGALFLSELVIGFYSHMYMVYGSFILIVCIGMLLRRWRKPRAIAAATLSSSILFFAITNFGVWALGSLYPRTTTGLFACYVAAIPFFQNTLLGDAFYTALLFGGFTLAEKWWPVLRETRLVSGQSIPRYPR